MFRFSKLTLIFGLFFISACSSDSGSGAKSPGGVVTAGAGGCSSVTASSVTYNYCVSDTKGALKKTSGPIDIVYFWHGINGGPRDIFNNAVLSRIDQVLGSRAPVVISISKGPQGVIGNDATEVVNTVIPAIEKAEGASTLNINRQMMGISMGGHNALRVVAKSSVKFAAVSALCPALVAVNLHDEAELTNYRERHAAYLNVDFFNTVLAVFKANFPSANDWNENNPLEFLKKNFYKHTEIYLSVGLQDSLGFQEGVKHFESNAPERSKRREVVTSYVDGPHCAFDIPQLGSFVERHLTAP